MTVVRNANEPCRDAVPGDEHLAESNRKRCDEHYLKWKVDVRAKSKAKTAGRDVSNWNHPPCPRTGRVSLLPKAVWVPLAEVHERLYEASHALATAVARRADLPLSEATVLKDAIDAAITENQKLLYGEGEAPDDAAGPLSEAHTDVGRPGQREDRSQGKTPLA